MSMFCICSGAILGPFMGKIMQIWAIGVSLSVFWDILGFCQFFPQIALAVRFLLQVEGVSIG